MHKISYLVWSAAVVISLSGCGPRHDRSATDVPNIVQWDGHLDLRSKGRIPGTKAFYVANLLTSLIPDKDKFEASDAYNTRIGTLIRRGKFGEFDLAKLYLFSDVTNWNYDADKGTLEIQLPSVAISDEGIDNYSATNAFGTQVSVTRYKSKDVVWEYFYPGSDPNNCEEGIEEFGPRWGTEPPRDVLSTHDISLMDYPSFTMRMASDIARLLPEKLEVITLVDFDTRALASRKSTLCLVQHDYTTFHVTPTLEHPNEVDSESFALNARLHRVIVRNPQTGDVLFDYAFIGPPRDSSPIVVK